MAFTKGKSTKKSMGKKFYKKRGPSNYKLYKMIKQARPEVKEIIYRYDSVGGGAINFSSVGYGGDAKGAALVGGIAQGVGDHQRIGNSIRVIGIQFNLAVQPGDNTNYFRLMLVRPKTDTFNVFTGGATMVQNILSGIASGTTQWLSPVDTDRYIKYYDKHAYLTYGPIDGSTASTVPKRIAFFKKFIKLNAKMQWDQEGRLTKDFVVLAISDSGVLSHPGVVAGFIKLFYTDA